MRISKHIFCFILIFCFLLFSSISAKEEKFYKLIPSKTFAYLSINVKDKTILNDLPYSTDSIFYILSNNAEECGIDVFENINLFYNNPFSIISKTPTLIGKIKKQTVFLEYLKKTYGTSIKDNIYTLTPIETTKKNVTSFYLIFVDDYFILSSSPIEIKTMIDIYSGKKGESFFNSETCKELVKTFSDKEYPFKIYINVEELLKLEPLLKQVGGISIQSILAGGGGFSSDEVKQIAQADIDQIFSYLSQIHYLSFQYNHLDKNIKAWIKFKPSSPLLELTKLPQDKLNLFKYLPSENVLLTWNLQKNSKIRYEYYDYALQKAVKFDSSRNIQKNLLEKIKKDLEYFGPQETWAWINGQEGLVWADIIEVGSKKNEEKESILEKRFSGLNVFFKSKQNWKMQKGESFDFKQIKIQSEKIENTPITANILQMLGFTSKLPIFNVWHAYIDNVLIITIEDKPDVLKEIISIAKKEKKSLLDKTTVLLNKNSKYNNLIFFSPKLISLYLNYNLQNNDQSKNDSSFVSSIINTVPLVSNILTANDAVVTGTSQNNGFYFVTIQQN